ncbi:polypeptide N-acetylgalactosaminyltransferase 17-like isoform X1 [Corythoichthys intestinalis]|uniref:polypeptide N-acetylgalactosaminyltransferase 17-like isoform X1 n=1 Tax=Corythoichthys intestinalis TaxID=161448 RepID=UPI0025A68EB2|nr:polypeptide N-acetylgalactosaminyltransferase 17-like isoform X1 [Corythoichthys intestinalis]
MKSCTHIGRSTLETPDLSARYFGLAKPLGLVEGFGAPGSDGLPIKLSEEEEKLSEIEKIKYGYDSFMSDKISLDRKLPDFRPSKCKEYIYPKDLPTISLIFIFVNEALSVILRSIHSAVNHTPAQLLKEIILVDDCSDDERLKEPLENYVNKRYPGLVKIVRNKKREGLIRARIEGWKVATAEVTGFFDAHMEFTPFWAEPALARIKEDITRIVLPSIDNIKYDTFELQTYGLPAHGYDWQLWCKYIAPSKEWKDLNDKSAPIRSPAMIGCSFLVHRVFFGELGLFDPDMDTYGGENVELGIRTWLCGGSMEMLPCSRVAHISRFKKPYLEEPLHIPMRRNGLRVAEVWFDEYKPNFYYAWNIPMEGHGIDYGNITHRVELRKRLHCKNFKWYLDNVYPQMRTYLDTVIYGVMNNTHANFSHLCLDQGERKDHEPILFRCHGLPPQLVRYTSKNQLYIGTLGNSFFETRCLVDDPDIATPQLLDCDQVKDLKLTKWKYTQGNEVRNMATGRCMEVVSISKKLELIMRSCTGQKWNLKTPPIRY